MSLYAVLLLLLIRCVEWSIFHYSWLWEMRWRMKCSRALWWVLLDCKATRLNAGSKHFTGGVSLSSLNNPAFPVFTVETNNVDLKCFVPFDGTGKRFPRSTSSWAWLQDEMTLQTTLPIMLRSIAWMVTILPVKVTLWPSGVSWVMPSMPIISRNINGWNMLGAPQFRSKELPNDTNKFLYPW